MKEAELHQKATNILGQVLELSRDDALARIERITAGNDELRDLVLQLYQEIEGDGDTSTSPENQTTYHQQETRRVGEQVIQSQTTLIGDFTKRVFGKKRNRLIFLVVSLAILMVLGQIARSTVRNKILESEKAEKLAFLNTDEEILKRWIDLEIKRMQAVAEYGPLKQILPQLNQLASLEDGYQSFKESEIAIEGTSILQEIKQWGSYDEVGLMHPERPEIMLLSSPNGSVSEFSGVALGDEIYTSYLKVRSGIPIFIPPISDEAALAENPSEVSTVNTAFASPVLDSGKIIGIIYGTYRAHKDFSNIFKLSHHGLSSESYAFNLDGRIISSSRFTSDLQRTFLLDYDSTRGSLWNLQLKDPGGDVTEGHVPDKSILDLPNTEIFSQARLHISSSDSILSGSVIEPYRDYRGIEVIGAWKWLPEYGIGIITEENASDALSTLFYFDLTFFGSYFLILVLFILLYNSNVRVASFGRKIDDIQKLGQYKLLEKLGEGGFGKVYKGQHNFLKSPVAIKLLKPELVGTDSLHRFEKEVKVTSSLQHPNTIRVFDYGNTDDGQFYYVMEYLEGITLEKLLKSEEQFPVARALSILHQVCLSLREAHYKGFAHRDIKPMNIMLTKLGGAYDVVKVLDFGLVKNVENQMTQQTELNKIGGTPMFMAPERIRDPFNADLRVDIYSIGAVGLYVLSGKYLVELISSKMLSGQETLQGNFKNHMFDRMDIPLSLQSILTECIHFDPEKRPQRVEDLIDVFESLMESYPWTRRDTEKWWKEYDEYSVM